MVLSYSFPGSVAVLEMTIVLDLIIVLDLMIVLDLDVYQPYSWNYVANSSCPDLKI
jgi:hypothetical protein